MKDSPVAQPVERIAVNDEVAGSSPAGGATCPGCDDLKCIPCWNKAQRSLDARKVLKANDPDTYYRSYDVGVMWDGPSSSMLPKK